MPPTPALVGASGTSSSDDAIQPPSIEDSATLEIIPPFNEYSVTTPLPPSQTLRPGLVLSAPYPLASTSHPGLEMVRNILQFVGAASLAVCKAIDMAAELEHEERQALKELRKGVESLKSDTVVFIILKTNIWPGRLNLEDATYEIFVCQQNNERAFKLIWNLYVVAQQWTGFPFSVDIIGNVQDRVGQALDSVLQAFHAHPFAVSPEGDSRITFALLNHNHGTATRYEQLARQIGKAWVDDRAPRYNAQVRDTASLQTSLFELLWSGTVEQLKRHSAYSSDDPERPEFERAVEDLEKALQGAIVRSKKQRFTIAFCGTVQAGKSLFLNAFMGHSILPSDGKSHNSRAPSYTDYHCRAPFYGLAMPSSPCRRPNSP